DTCLPHCSARVSEAVDVGHQVAVSTGGGCTCGASWPPFNALLRTARSNDEGAPSGFAFPLVWPGALTLAPTKATPKTSAVSAAIAVLAPRARARAASIRELRAMASTSVPASDERPMGAGWQLHLSRAQKLIRWPRAGV